MQTSDSSDFSPSNKPRLERRDANRPFPTSKPAMTPMTISAVDPQESILQHNFSVIHHFKKRLFLQYGENVLRGFIRRNESDLQGRRVVPGIINICISYYVDDEAGIFQIGHRLHRVLRKSRRRTIALKTVRAFLEQYVQNKGRGMISVKNVDIDFICNELVRLGYLVPIGKGTRSCELSETNLYQIPMGKVLEFTCKSHQKV